MCWIFWYIGTERDVNTVLLHGLERLEYRGYDSAGLAVLKPWTSKVYKAVWRVQNLVQEVKDANPQGFSCGIAHTRWATHGKVTKENCHPHMSNDGQWTIVHNGIVENYLSLKNELIKEWYIFSSETDTEVVANLLQHLDTGDMIETIQKVTQRIRGAYALLVMHSDHQDQLVGVRLWSPLIFGYEDQQFFFSSDAQALTGYTDKAIYLEDGDILAVKNGDFLVYAGGKPVVRDVEELDQTMLEASKWKFKHFMLKEIHEQPNIVRRIFKWRIDFKDSTLKADAFEDLHRRGMKQMKFVACGSSYYAALLWWLRCESLGKIPAYAYLANEMEHRPLFVDDQTAFTFISQSGETADSMSILKLIKENNGKTFGIVNVPGSSIARLTDAGLFTRAGTEVWVASTKAFMGQLICLLMMSLYIGKQHGMTYSTYKAIIRDMEDLPLYLETILDQTEYIRSVAEQVAKYDRFFFLGKGYQLPIAYECALKLKECSYSFAQGYGSWELKHGPLALIDKYTPTVILMPDDELFESNMNALHEIKARGGKVLVISDTSVHGADWQITIPSSHSVTSPFLTTMAGQLLTYHIADILGRDIDKPRNLAKSVTVK